MANAVSANDDGASSLTPIPLTNGHSETPIAVSSTNNGDPNDLKSPATILLTNGHSESPTAASSTNNGHLDDRWSPATKLKHRLEDTKDLIVCPGVYDGFSARIALSVGFDAMYMVRADFLGGFCNSREGFSRLTVF